MNLINTAHLTGVLCVNTKSMTIQIGKKTRTIPASWNDLPLNLQLHIFTMLNIQLHHLDARTLEQVQRQEIMRMILKLEPKDLHLWRRDRRKAYGKRSGDQVFFSELDEVIKAATGFLFIEQTDEDGSIAYEVNPTLTKCPYPVIAGTDAQGNAIELHAPADVLDNLSFYEIGAVFTLYENFARARHIDDALALLATIYRPAKPATEENLASNYQGDIRQPYRQHESTVQQRTPYLRAVPPIVRGLLLFWVGSCLHNITVKQYPNLFESTEENTRRVGNDYGWAGTLLTLAGGPVHLNDMADQNFHNAFIWMSMKEDERKLAEFKENAAKVGRRTS